MDEYGLELNQKTAIFPLRNGIDFLGFHSYLTETGAVVQKLRRDSAKRMKAKIRHWEKAYPAAEVTKEEIPQAVVAVLSGPSHAEEVGRGIPTTCVIGTANKKDAEYLQNMFMSNVFRVYISPDVLGICIGGALKNVIALAACIADGLGYGDNTKAALITRGNAEITRLGVAMGANPHTFAGLSGIGDLIVTCASMHSRNRRAGILIGKGYTKDEAMKEVQMVVEGVFSAKAALELSKKYNIEMPIVEQVNKVLFEDKPAAEAVKELMLRDKKIEAGNVDWN